MIMKVPQNLSNSGYYDPLDFDEEPDMSSDLENDDFSEYLWMEYEEEFDKMEMQRLEEEEIMKECLEAMYEDELEAELASVEPSVMENQIENSTLNPLAAEFIPGHFLVSQCSN